MFDSNTLECVKLQIIIHNEKNSNMGSNFRTEFEKNTVAFEISTVELSIKQSFVSKRKSLNFGTNLF